MYDYDDADQLTSIWHKHNGGATLSRYQYGYDDAGNRKWVKRDDGRGDVYSYDAADQLPNVKYNATNPDGTPSGWDREGGYGYSAAGNRTGMVENVGGATNKNSHTGNGLNQLTDVTTMRQRLTVIGSVEPLKVLIKTKFPSTGFHSPTRILFGRNSHQNPNPLSAPGLKMPKV